MKIIEKDACYGVVMVVMKDPEFNMCVMNTKVGKPETSTYGMTGYIPVDVEFEVNDIRRFAELWHKVTRDEKYRDEIISIDSRLGNARC